MNIGPEHPTDREPLTAEERELAQRLSRLGPSAGPHSTVDARILAAAHDAVTPPRARIRPRPWPVALGVAASLALAVGIAWRLRPLPEPPQAATPAAASTETSATFLEEAPAIEAAPSASHEESRPDDVPAASPEVAKIQARRRPVPAAAAEPEAAMDERPVADVAAAAPPPPAPPAPVAQAPAAQALSATAVDAAAAGASPSPEERQRMAKAVEASQDARRDAQLATASQATPTAAATAHEKEPAAGKPEIVELDNGDEPPAYASSPQVREAWLQRIRELVAEGKPQQALDSLHEFQRRYPGQPLPDDLQRFEQSHPDPLVP
ncbi:transcription initiation factor TFIID subunit 4 [Luteimonas cucumeris]|uniref:Transcription initiation factor TFIID subunit 4 n=1 Tax=Luteimonas cucumeris TaxID=985012 RepID=A0A562L7B5_9GAMM|nr:hypothetical protein [Luteimonas cucumeris]TWI03523.1 transcription initiation factor TFIID subunit 4 [Luteimonas cucumeris]